MAHDFAWKANGSALSDHTDFVRVLNEGGGGKRVGNVVVPYRHGEWSNPDKWWDGADLLLEVGLKRDDSYEHLSAVQYMLGGSQLVSLQRVTPHAGTVIAEVEMQGPPNPTQNRFVYVFPLRVPSGFWRDASASTASGTAPSITTTGDRPIDDMIVTFSAPGTVTLADTVYGTATVGWAGSSGTAILDCGARTIRQGSTKEDANLVVSEPWWLRFRPQATVNLTATSSVHVRWWNKWAAG